MVGMKPMERITNVITSSWINNPGGKNDIIDKWKKGIYVTCVNNWWMASWVEGSHMIESWSTGWLLANIWSLKKRYKRIVFLSGDLWWRLKIRLIITSWISVDILCVICIDIMICGIGISLRMKRNTMHAITSINCLTSFTIKFVKSLSIFWISESMFPIFNNINKYIWLINGKNNGSNLTFMLNNHCFFV